MDWSTVISLVLGIVKYIPDIITAWEKSPTNSVQAVNNVVKDTPIAGDLAKIGAAIFPKLSPEFHAAAAALIIAHPNNTSWAQEGLNLIASTGYITYPKQTGFPLSVDGIFGNKTFTAVQLLQTKLGYPVNGFISDIEYNAIQSLLSKL